MPTGHKFAIEEIKENEDVVKYGYSIGHATTGIRIGDHVHTHNV
ncbi:MAG: SAF domain-containing protein, partial [Prevotella sp.]|nr:SAF domain-containing protein [Prevotella sp.]